VRDPQLEFVVGPADRGKRLDRFLQERIPGLSRTRIRQVIEHRVSLSWPVSPRPARTVQPGGVVRIRPRPSVEVVRSYEIPILRRGSGWLAVEKPAGVLVHPVRDVVENSLIRTLRRQESDPALRLVHRLDGETSGVMLVARNRETAAHFAGAFERGAVHKEYLAWVRGRVQGEEGLVEGAIGSAPASKIYVRQAVVRSAGKAAVTGWKVEMRCAGATLLRLFPRQGRRHQLRVHLESIGHPIRGDILYGRPDEDYLDWIAGDRDPRREAGEPSRQLLHCANLRVEGPSGAELDLRSETPDDFVHFERSRASDA
jgi:23S rRNA pseudouridine1911/1915/1917 synthase